MIPEVKLPLLPSWKSSSETIEDSGELLAHVQYFLSDDESGTDKALVDIYAGPMPPGSDPEQEALNSYFDIVGVDDPEDEEDPLTIWPFQGKDAFGYEAICDDDSIMRVMCIEYLPGVLVIMDIVARDEDLFAETVAYVEKNLSVK